MKPQAKWPETKSSKTHMFSGCRTRTKIISFKKKTWPRSVAAGFVGNTEVAGCDLLWKRHPFTVPGGILDSGNAIWVQQKLTKSNKLQTNTSLIQGTDPRHCKHPGNQSAKLQNLNQGHEGNTYRSLDLWSFVEFWRFPAISTGMRPGLLYSAFLQRSARHAVNPVNPSNKIKLGRPNITTYHNIQSSHPTLLQHSLSLDPLPGAPVSQCPEPQRYQLLIHQMLHSGSFITWFSISLISFTYATECNTRKALPILVIIICIRIISTYFMHIITHCINQYVLMSQHLTRHLGCLAWPNRLATSTICRWKSAWQSGGVNLSCDLQGLDY